MLPSELLRIRTSKGRIYPQFCSVDGNGKNGGSPAASEVASGLISEFERVQRRGGTRSELLGVIADMEPDYDYKLVRGLRTLLERRSSFVMQHPGSGSTVSSPLEVRQALFAESSRAGLATSDAKRDAIIKRVADLCRIPRGEVPRVMWADLEENHILGRFDAIAVKDLLLWYNMSLAQTLLFHCTRLVFHVGGEGGQYWKHILRNVKMHGLMYTLESGDDADDGGSGGSGGSGNRKSGGKGRGGARDDDDDGSPTRCVLEGPLGLFKMTTRYGTAFARMLPIITRTPSWGVDAVISRKTDSGTKLYRFEMSSATTKEYLRAVSDGPEYAQKGAQEAYDSLLERKFADILRQHLGQGDSSGWRVTREPGPLMAGNKAMLPDFVFERLGRRVYLEIVGFWTPDYLRRKVAKMREILVDTAPDGAEGQRCGRRDPGRVDMLVAVNSSLLCSQVSEIGNMPGVFTFGKDISVKPILDHLKQIDSEIEQDTVLGTQIVPGDLGPIALSIRDVALKYGISEGSVSAVFESSVPGMYAKAGSYMIHATKASGLSGMIAGVGKFVDACDVLRREGIPDESHADLLSYMGYDVVWPDLDPANARIRKKGR